MVGLGFLQGKSNPCVSYRPGRGSRVIVRGDEFASTGSYEDTKSFHSEPAKVWMVVELWILGPPGAPTPNAIQEIRVLNHGA